MSGESLMCSRASEHRIYSLYSSMCLSEKSQTVCTCVCVYVHVCEGCVYVHICTEEVLYCTGEEHRLWNLMVSNSAPHLLTEVLGKLSNFSSLQIPYLLNEFSDMPTSESLCDN